MTKLLSLFLTILFILPAAAQSDGGRIVVVAEARVDASPDLVRVGLGVETRAQTARQALSRNSQDLAGVIEALRANGVDRADIQTRDIGLFPQFDHNRTGEPPRVAGYVATNMLSVRVRNISTIGKLLDDVSRAGANRIQSIQFDVEDRAQHQDSARRRAVEIAKARAALYASAAEVTLGGVLSISEGAPVARNPGGPVMRAMEAAPAAVPVEGGSIEISATVTMVFALTP